MLYLIRKNKISEQAGAVLGQAQIKLEPELGLRPLKIFCLDQQRILATLAAMPPTTSNTEYKLPI